MPIQRRALVNTTMVVAAIISVQVGGAFAKTTFDEIGASGMTFLRLGFAAIVLCAIGRPTLHGRSRRDWLLTAAFGALMAVLCLASYAAVDHLAIGLVVTLQLLGPLTLAVVTSRRVREFAWTGVALAGVVLLGQTGSHIDPLGVLFALIGGASWVGYILLSAETGKRTAGVDGLALAISAAALITAPIGIAGAGTALLRPHILFVGFGVAMMTSVINFGLELIALREMRPRTFGVLMSLSPAMAALSGFVVLGQRLELLQIVAIGLVIAASAGTVTD